LYEVSPLLGLKMKLGGNTEIIYTRGYHVEPKKNEDDINWQETSLEDVAQARMTEKIDADIKAKRQKLLEEAVALAKVTDEVIIIGGLNHDYESEGLDRKDMKLPYEQDTLIKEVLKVNPNTVVVMMAGSPVEMGEWIQTAKAVVWCWYGGMEGGTALAEVLLGEVNPSGKLPMTFPKKLSDCSAYSLGEFPGGKTVSYSEGIFVGYRYYDTYKIEPEFCFGHGLSYTTFDYDNMCLEVEETDDVKISVTFEVTNKGNRTGMETAQLYVACKNSTVNRPVQELKQYIKVELKPGQKEKVTLVLDKTAFGYYNTDKKQFQTEVGTYEIRVGSSSRDIRLKGEIELKQGYCY
jgi:beta-glucosidase